jgi:predicted O-methyltransferase YrrM
VTSNSPASLSGLRWHHWAGEPVSAFKHQIRQLFVRARWTLREKGLASFVQKALRYPFKPVFVPGAANALKDGRRRVQSLEHLYDFVNGFNYRGITITTWQKKAEIVSLLRLLEQSPPKRIVEIGTANGGTLFMLTQVAAPDATIVSVDLPGGRLGGASSTVQNRYPQWRARLYRGFGRDKQLVHVIRADSHDVSTVEDVHRRLPEGKVDFLFIDGDHSYKGVRRDFELYSPLVAAGGLVAFHDIMPSRPAGHGDPGDVPVFWSEVRNNRKIEAEFVEDRDWGSCGIGVIRL